MQEISQVAKLPPATATVHQFCHYPSYTVPSYCPFDLLIVVPFLVFSLFLPHCNSVCNVIFVICKGGLAIKAPMPSTVGIFSINKIYFWMEAFSALASFPFLSFSLIFSHFLSFSR